MFLPDHFTWDGCVEVIEENAEMQMNRLLSSFVYVLLVSMNSVAALTQPSPDVAARVSQLETQVEQDLQEKKPQLAIPLLRQIISLDANNLKAHANLGVLLFFQGNYSEAIPQLHAALNAQPDLWKIDALLGIAEKRTGDSAAAQNELEHAFPKLDEKGIQVEAGLELVELYSASGQLGKAASIAETLETIAPQEPQILLAAYQISMQITDRSLLSMAMLAPDSAEMHMMMADKFGRDGDHANAIAQYRAAIRVNARLPGAHFELAEQLRTSDDPAVKAQAAQEYKAALGVNAFDEKSWRGLGEVLAEKGDYTAAKEDYGKALALQPHDADAETDLAVAWIALHDNAQAVTLLESAVKDDPTNIVAHFRLSTLYRQLGRTEDSEHEMQIFRHYKAMKDKLGSTFRQMSTQSAPQ